MQLFDRECFATFHSPALLTSSDHKYCFSKRFQPVNKYQLSNMLSHRQYCTSCATLQRSGTVAAKLEELRQPIFCTSCQEEHAALFFTPEDRINSLGETGEK